LQPTSTDTEENVTYRIAILTTAHSALDDRIFYKQAISLAQSGFAVTLFAQAGDEAVARQTCERHGIAYVALTPNGRPKRWVQLARELHAHRNDFDAWHFHDPELLPQLIVWRALFAPRVQLVYDVHEDMPKVALSWRWMPARLRKPAAWLVYGVEAWGMRQCNLLVTVTDVIGQRAGRSAKHVVVVRNYPTPRELPPAAHQSTANNGRLRAIYCGGLYRKRGIGDLVEAMNLLSDLPLDLILLGPFDDEDFEAEVRQSARDNANIKILGAMAFEAVWPQLQASHIGLMSYWATPAYLEAIPIKLFEYMQVGLPVVATDLPPSRVVMDDANCGLLVPPQRPDLMAQAIRVLVLDPAMRQRMGLAGQQAIAQKYAWQFEFQKLQAAYSEMAAGLLQRASAQSAQA
jgi:hypothetical protein